jgi:tRNA (mo5U34)-methyltransferase
MTLEEAREIIDKAEYWHYQFHLPWRETLPTKPGWAWRVSRRRGHFFQALLNHYQGDLNGKSVLDLGCCQGYWSFECQKAGAESCLGFDSSPFFTREAQAVAAVLGMNRCTFFEAHLEEDPWWKIEPREVTLMLGVLYHLTDPIYVLRRAMRLTKETIVIDGEAALGSQPCWHHRTRVMTELTTVRSNITSTLRMIPTISALQALLKDGGIKTIRVLDPKDMMEEYKLGTTISIVATR